MNITLNEVVFIDQRKQMHAFETFMVPARIIKYVHIPKEVIWNMSIYKKFFITVVPRFFFVYFARKNDFIS